jgi:hypothetical protein
MYLPLTHLGKSLTVLLVYLFALAFLGLVVGIYCQEWRISATKAGAAWDVQFNFKFFYLYNYKALKLNNVSALVLGTTTTKRNSRRNTLSAALGDGSQVNITSLVPYGMPQILTAFIAGINAKISGREGGAFDETFKFRPLAMADVFLYGFGGMFILIALFALIAGAGLASSLAAPAFIKADGGKVEYRRAGWRQPVLSVPASEVKNFEFSRETLPQDVPAWLAAMAGENGLRQMTADKKRATNNLILNLKDGSRVAFYDVDSDEPGAQASAAALNKALGVQ